MCDFKAATPRALQRSKSYVGKRIGRSKRRYEYEIAIAGDRHRVVVDLSKVSGKRSLTIDGSRVEGFKSHHSTTVRGAHTLDVRIDSRAGLLSHAVVLVDGIKFKRLPVGGAAMAAAPPGRAAAASPPPPLRVAGRGATGALRADADRAIVAAALPETWRERELDLVHRASEDGYDLDRACAALGPDAALVAVLVFEGGAFGAVLARLPGKRDAAAPDADAALFALAPPAAAYRLDAAALAADPAAFVVSARTDAFLAVGLDAASGGAALRVDAGLVAGTSDASPLFASPRLHGGPTDAFAVLDFELFALRPHRHPAS